MTSYAQDDQSPFCSAPVLVLAPDGCHVSIARQLRDNDGSKRVSCRLSGIRSNGCMSLRASLKSQQAMYSHAS